jgi:hypothetical protein
MAEVVVPLVVRSQDDFWHFPEPPPDAGGWLICHDQEPVAYVPRGSPMIGDGPCLN